MAIIELKGYSCERCKHEWVPRSKIDELPTICPKCKSPYWNKPRQSELQQAKEALYRKRRNNS